jgi:hypothetical protein
VRGRPLVRLLAMLAAVLLASCGDDAGADARPPEVADPRSAVMLPSDMPAAIGRIFPATGDRGRVLNNCSICHAVACLAVDRRSEAEWDAVEVSHEYYIPGLSKEDFGKIFLYLRRNFNDRLPEPDVPAELLAGGCPQLDSTPADSAVH